MFFSWKFYFFVFAYRKWLIVGSKMEWRESRTHYPAFINHIPWAWVEKNKVLTLFSHIERSWESLSSTFFSHRANLASRESYPHLFLTSSKPCERRKLIHTFFSHRASLAKRESLTPPFSHAERAFRNEKAYPHLFLTPSEPFETRKLIPTFFSHTERSRGVLHKRRCSNNGLHLEALLFLK